MSHFCFQHYSEILFLSVFYRGEKLYVTKDKRIKSRWRKWLCWAIILALLVSLIIIGLLSASKKKNYPNIPNESLKRFIFSAGVIFSAKPTPIESRQFNSNDVQASGILGVSGSRKSNVSQSTPITTSSTASSISSVSITTDENIIYGILLIYHTNLVLLNCNKFCIILQYQILWRVN